MKRVHGDALMIAVTVGAQSPAAPSRSDTNMKLPFSQMMPSDDREFLVAGGDFSGLEIRDAQKEGGLHYFYDTNKHGLITDFVIEDRPQVRTLVRVTLVKKDEKYQARVRLWKKQKTRRGDVAVEEIAGSTATRSVKASVDVDEGHEQFWRLIDFLRQFTGIDLPADEFRVVEHDGAELVRLLKGQDKDAVISAVQATVGGSLTEADISLLANRRGQLSEFRRLLEEPDFFEESRAALTKAAGANKKAEAVWQEFFERNPWIFGYGLSLISCESVNDERLEQITTGSDAFAGAGKRIDGLMRTRGYVSSLLLVEIKTHEKDLLASAVYRAPDVYRPSNELVGAVAQVQKTTDKVVRGVHQQLVKLYEKSGEPTGIEVGTVRPRQVVVIGRLDEFATENGLNREKVHSLELFRRSLLEVEVITFDELLARASFIVEDGGPSSQASPSE